MEVLTARKSGREGHRQWPDEVKAKIETPVVEPPATKPISRAEIIVGPVTIRLEEGASALDHQFAQLREEPPHRLA